MSHESAMLGFLSGLGSSIFLAGSFLFWKYSKRRREGVPFMDEREKRNYAGQVKMAYLTQNIGLILWVLWDVFASQWQQVVPTNLAGPTFWLWLGIFGLILGKFVKKGKSQV